MHFFFLFLVQWQKGKQKPKGNGRLMVKYQQVKTNRQMANKRTTAHCDTVVRTERETQKGKDKDRNRSSRTGSVY